LSIIDSIVYGIECLPEAKIGPVKRMPKRGMDSCGLHVLTFYRESGMYKQPENRAIIQ